MLFVFFLKAFVSICFQHSAGIQPNKKENASLLLLLLFLLPLFLQLSQHVSLFVIL
jgi:hypothetical protein